MSSSSSIKKSHHGWLLFILLITSFMLRVYDYLPLKTLAMELTTLLVCTLFYLERSSYIDEYNKSEEAEKKEELQEKIAARKSYLNLVLGVFFILVISGYYDIKTAKNEFTHLNVFRCESKNGFEVYVDKKEGWILSDDYFFINGKSKINAFNCKRADKE